MAKPKKKAASKAASDAARALGRLGASKGGAARAAQLTPERRTEIARDAARHRWDEQRKAEES